MRQNIILYILWIKVRYNGFLHFDECDACPLSLMEDYMYIFVSCGSAAQRGPWSPHS